MLATLVPRAPDQHVMLNTLEHKLIAVASAFRNAFENLDPSNAPGSFSKFPNGCCGSASVFVGNFLKEYLNLNPKCSYKSLHSSGAQHEFLVLDDIIIDITADQFHDCSDRVVVSKNSTWHKKLEGGEIRKVYSVSEQGELFVNHYKLFDNPNIYHDIYSSMVSSVISELRTKHNLSISPNPRTSDW